MKVSRDYLLQQRAEILKKLDEVKELDPFRYFVPSDGKVTEEDRVFLEEFLKPEDIPQGKLDSQLDFLLSKADVRGNSGGNQGGKSTITAIDCYIYMTNLIPKSIESIYPKEKLSDKPYKRGRVVGVDAKTMVNTLLPTYMRWCPRDVLKNGSWSDSFSFEHQKLFLYRDGSEIGDIEFKTNQQDVESFQGNPLDILIYDEEPLQKIHKENLMRFTTADRLNITFAWTPTKGLTWLSDDFDEEGGKSGKELFKIPSITNKKANKDTLRQILKEEDDYNVIKMRLLGEAVSLSGLIYGKLFNPKIHTIEPFEINKKDYVVFIGLDPHQVTPTAGVFMAVDRELNCYVIDCYYKNSYVEEVKNDINARIKDKGMRVIRAIADRSSDVMIKAIGKNIFEELRRGDNGIKCLVTSEKWGGSIKDGVNEIKKYLRLNEKTGKPRLFIFNTPNNRQLIQSFRTLERDTYENEDKKGEKDKIREGRHHLHAALRYIFQLPIYWYEENEAKSYIPEYIDEVTLS